MTMALRDAALIAPLSSIASPSSASGTVDDLGLGAARGGFVAPTLPPTVVGLVGFLAVEAVLLTAALGDLAATLARFSASAGRAVVICTTSSRASNSSSSRSSASTESSIRATDEGDACERDTDCSRATTSEATGVLVLRHFPHLD